MKIGSLIKFHRTKLGLTQNELAMGICSIPHLSKIENNSKEANEETIRLLLEKLNIQLQEVKDSEMQIIKLLNELQKHINYINHDKVEEIIGLLNESEELITFTDSIYLYELYKLRYYVFVQNIELAEKQLSWLNNNKQNFSQYEKGLLSYFCSLVLAVRGKYEEANILLSELLQEFTDLGPFEGELYYHLAIVKGRLDECSQAIIFGRKALTYFKDQFNFKRIIYTLMSLALNYANEKLYNEALEIYEHLFRNVELLQEQHLLPQIYQNVGNLHLRRGDEQNALTYYEKSTLVTSRDHPHYFICLYNLAFMQYQMKQYEKSRESFLFLKKEAKNKQIYYLLATFYLYLLTEQEKRAMEFLEQRIIPQISKINELKESYSYLKYLLRDYLLAKGKYEKALQFIN